VTSTLDQRVVVRHRITVTGAVQGVGLRPFVFRLAQELALAGFVGNDAAGAFVEVEGPAAVVAQFETRLRLGPPPLARVDALRANSVPVTGADAFTIVASVDAPGTRTLVSPDTATCDACLAELGDRGNRRYRHPFITCTDCGPRFTIIHDLPYDRPATTMAAFPLCAACAAEYSDPHDRRYHAQPIACRDCGPTLRFIANGQTVTGTDAALAAVHAGWAAGKIVAVKGIGGYHLTCDAASDTALTLLRQRKHRTSKPFAVMVATLAAARSVALLDETESSVLTANARPIVVARRRTDAPVSALIAPGSRDIGVMLAYSALHHLLLVPVPGAHVVPPRVIVATSGNHAGEPLCTGDDEAFTRLADLADAFLVHDRDIHVPCDDSVVRVGDAAVRPVRRSRGYAPLPVTLPAAVVPTLAVGGELKNTFCLAAGGHGWLSQHIGDVENLETLHALQRSIKQFRAIYRIDPEVVATDAHPRYLSRRYAFAHRGEARIVEVQHHHAHIASLMAEHGLDGTDPVIGIVLDGSGYGTALAGGAAIWGGEVLVADYHRYRRAGHLSELPLAGGDQAVRNPCRVALGYLAACGIDPDPRLAPFRAADDVERRVVARQVATGSGVVPTTSMGRLFDAVSSLLGVCHRVTYEAQAAIELEALASSVTSAPRVRFGVDGNGVLDPTPVLSDLAAATTAGADPAELAFSFHEAVADGVARAANQAAGESGIRTVGLTGGVFGNRLLVRLCRAALADFGLDVLEHRIVPANDGGLALGQAVIAGLRDP
jgi:hydrogenase maturation protein HypF